MKLPVFIHAEWGAYERQYKYSVWSSDMTGYTGPLVGKTEIDFEPPSHAEMVKDTIRVLKGKQSEIRAKAEKEVTDIQGQIDDLLCLEYKPEPQA